MDSCIDYISKIMKILTSLCFVMNLEKLQFLSLKQRNSWEF